MSFVSIAASPDKAKIAPTRFTSASKYQNSLFKGSSASAEFARAYEEAHCLRPFSDFYDKVLSPESQVDGTAILTIQPASATSRQDFDASFAMIRGTHIDGITTGLGSRSKQEQELSEKNAQGAGKRKGRDDELDTLSNVKAPAIGSFASQANVMNIMTIALAAEAALNVEVTPQVSWDHERQRNVVNRRVDSSLELNDVNKAAGSRPSSIVSPKSHKEIYRALAALNERTYMPIRNSMMNTEVAKAALALIENRDAFRDLFVFSKDADVPTGWQNHLFTHGLSESDYYKLVDLVLNRYDVIRATACTMPPQFPPKLGEVPQRTNFSFSVVGCSGKDENGTWSPVDTSLNQPASTYILRNDLSATETKIAMQYAGNCLADMAVSNTRMLALLAAVTGKDSGSFGAALAKRRELFRSAKETFGAKVTVSSSKALKLAELRSYVADAALSEIPTLGGMLKPYPAFDLKATGKNKGYAELNDSMVTFDVQRFAPSGAAVREVVDAFIKRNQSGLSEAAMLIAPLENKSVYMDFALALMAVCSYYHVRYNIALSRSYVHYVTQTPLDYARDEEGNVITTRDGSPKFAQANTGNFRAFVANNLRIALDIKLSKKSAVLPTDTVLSLGDLGEIRKRRAALGMIDNEDRTDEHGLYAAVKDNMTMAVLNESSTSTEARVGVLDERDGSLEFMPPVGGADDDTVSYYDMLLKQRESLLGNLGIAPQPFGRVDYSALPELAEALATSPEHRDHYLAQIDKLQAVETLLRGLSHLPMVKSFGLGVAISASDTSDTGYATTQLAACGEATKEAMATAVSNPHIYASAFGPAVKARSEIASSAQGFVVGQPRIGSPAVHSVVNDQATLIATLQAFGEIPSLQALLEEAAAEWSAYAAGFGVSLAPTQHNGVDVFWTPEQRVQEWNPDFVYPLVFADNGEPALNEATASEREYPAVVSPEYKSTNKGVLEAIADNKLPEGSQEHLRWIPTIETILALTMLARYGLSHDGSSMNTVATPMTNVIRYWLENDVYRAAVQGGMRQDFTAFLRACTVGSTSFAEGDTSLSEDDENHAFMDESLEDTGGNAPLPTYGNYTSKQLTWFGLFQNKVSENSAGVPPGADIARHSSPETMLGFYVATRLGKKLVDAMRDALLDADSHLYRPFAPMRASYVQDSFVDGKQVMKLDSTEPLYTYEQLSSSIGPATAAQYIAQNDEVLKRTLQRGERFPTYNKNEVLRDTLGKVDPKLGRIPPEHPEYLKFKNISPDLSAMVHQLVALVRVQKERPQVAITAIAPGGGKTFFAIVSAMKMAEICQAEGKPFRPLFLSPPKLIQNWHSDADKFGRGRINVFTLDSDAFGNRDNNMLRQQITSAPINTIFVGSYDMLKAGGGSNSLRLQIGSHTSAIGARLDYLLALGFTHIFYDESHRAKNSTGLLNRIVAQLNAQKGVQRILATGTFISNMLGDAHGQLAAADPVLAGSRSVFDEITGHDSNVKGYNVTECQKYGNYLSSHTTMINVQQRDWAYNLPLPVYETHMANSYPKDSITNLLTTKTMQRPGKDYLDALRYLENFKLLGGMTVDDMIAEDLRFNTFMQTVYVYLKKLQEDFESAGIADLFNSMMAVAADMDSDDTDGVDEDEGASDDLSEADKAEAEANKDAKAQAAADEKTARAQRKGETAAEAQARSSLIDKLQQVQQGLIPALTQFVKDAKAAPFNGESFAGMEDVGIARGQLDLNIVTPAVKYCYYKLHKHFFNGSNKPMYSDMGGKKVLVIVQNVRSAVAVFRDMPSVLKRHARLSFGAVPPKIEEKVNPDYVKDFDISPSELLAAKNAFCNDPNVWILVCTEKSVSEGFNFQIANRVIRIDIPFTPGEVKQTKSRVIRPDVSQTYVRDHAYIDTVMTEHTIDMARYLILVSKTLQALAFEYRGGYVDPLYAEATAPSKDLPLVKMNIDTLMNVSTLDDMRNFTNGQLDEATGQLKVFDYVSREQEFNRLELKGIEQELEVASRLCKTYGLPVRTVTREDGTQIERPSLMVKLEHDGMLEGSAMTLFEPAVAFVPCYKLRYLGLKVDSLDYVMNGTTEIADNLIDAHVYTEHGFGRLVTARQADGRWSTCSVLFPDGSVNNYKVNMVTLVENVKPEHEVLLNSMIDAEAWQKDSTFQLVNFEAIDTPKGTRFQKHRLEWNGREFVRGEALWGPEGSDYLNHYEDEVKKSSSVGGKTTVLKPQKPYTDGAHLKLRLDDGVSNRTAKEMVEEIGIGDGDWISNGENNYRVNFVFEIAENSKSTITARVVLTPFVDGKDGKAPVASGKPKSMTLAKFITEYGFKPQLLAPAVARQAAMSKTRRAAVNKTKVGYESIAFYSADDSVNDDFDLRSNAKIRFTLPQEVTFALLENQPADMRAALRNFARNDQANFTAFYKSLTENTRLPRLKDANGKETATADMQKVLNDLGSKLVRLRLNADFIGDNGFLLFEKTVGAGSEVSFVAPLGSSSTSMVTGYQTLAQVAENTSAVASYDGILNSAQGIMTWLESQTANPYTNFLVLPTSSMRDGKNYITFAEAVSEAGGAGNMMAQSADLMAAQGFVNPYDEAETIDVPVGVREPAHDYDEDSEEGGDTTATDQVPAPEAAPAPTPAPTPTQPVVKARFKPLTFVADDAAEVNVESYVVFTAPGSNPASTVMLALTDTGSGDFTQLVSTLREAPAYSYLRKDAKGEHVMTKVKPKLFAKDTYRTLVRVTSADNLAIIMDELAKANLLDLTPFGFKGDIDEQVDSWLSGFDPVVRKAANPNAFSVKVRDVPVATTRMVKALLGEAPIKAGKVMPVLCVADSAAADGDALYLMLVGFNMGVLPRLLRNLAKSGATTIVRAQGSVTPLSQGASVNMLYETLYSLTQHFAVGADNFKAIRNDLKEYASGVVKAKAKRFAR